MRLSDLQWLPRQVFGLALIAVGLVGLGVACGCMMIARALPEPKEGER